MPVFVYYNDGYYENGDVGFEELATYEAAVAFIERRLREAKQRDESTDLSCYQVIEGKRLVVEPAEYITSVKLR